MSKPQHRTEHSSEHHSEEEIYEEIKQEFQVERMILFSDAVFAIVITLMAIEIKVPEFELESSSSEIAHKLAEIIPFLLAYAVSFIFIGIIWFKHLRIFSLVKGYHAKLVAANLLLLFFVSLFPVSVGMVTKTLIHNFLPMIIYFSVITGSHICLLFLSHIILKGGPDIRLNSPKVKEEYTRFLNSKAALVGMIIMFSIASVTYLLIPIPGLKNLCWLSLSCTTLTIKWCKRFMTIENKRVSK